MDQRGELCAFGPSDKGGDLSVESMCLRDCCAHGASGGANATSSIINEEIHMIADEKKVMTEVAAPKIRRTDRLMFVRVSLQIQGGMTVREFAHLKKFGRDSLR